MRGAIGEDGVTGEAATGAQLGGTHTAGTTSSCSVPHPLACTIQLSLGAVPHTLGDREREREREREGKLVKQGIRVL